MSVGSTFLFDVKKVVGALAVQNMLCIWRFVLCESSFGTTRERGLTVQTLTLVLSHKYYEFGMLVYVFK